MKIKNPLISVIVPIYNAEKYIRRCIESILAQTFIDFELLLIDDGSKDNSKAICDIYLKKDDRIKVLHKINGGVSSARNLGLNYAKGKWVAFVDSDDWLEKSYLENFIQIVKNTDPDIIIESPIYVYKYGNKKTNIKDSFYEGSIGLRKFMLNGLLNFTEPHSKLFRLDIIKKYNICFPEDVRIGEDGIFITRFLIHSSKMQVSSKTGYYYSKLTESVQSKYYSPEIEISGIGTWKTYLYQLSNIAGLPHNNEAIWRILSSIIYRYLSAVSKNKNLTFREKLSWIEKLDDDCFTNYGIGRSCSLKGKILKAIIKRRYLLLIIYLFEYNK